MSPGWRTGSVRQRCAADLLLAERRHEGEDQERRAESRRPRRRTRPGARLPVAVLISPSIHGAPKPARLAIELISATPPAACRAGRKRFGICQNTGMALIVPTMASVSASSTTAALWSRKIAITSSDAGAERGRQRAVVARFLMQVGMIAVPDHAGRAAQR